jgi:hypothetical protein
VPVENRRIRTEWRMQPDRGEVRGAAQDPFCDHCTSAGIRFDRPLLV